MTLNRPEKLNALSNNLRAEVMDAMKVAEADPDVGVIVLKGAGRAFSAGYDLSPARAAGEDAPYVNRHSLMPDTGSTHPGPMEWARHVVMTNWFIWELSKPVVAQLHGYCLAGGTELASVCDFRIVEETMQVGYPPVRAMTTMDMMWTPWFLPPAKAREFAYVGDSFSGQQMADLGWANYALPLEELDDFTREFAERMTPHRQRHADVLEARGEPAVRDHGHPHRPRLPATTCRASAPTGRRGVSSGGAAARMASRPPSSGRDGPFRDFRGAYDSAPKRRNLPGQAGSEERKEGDY